MEDVFFFFFNWNLKKSMCACVLCGAAGEEKEKKKG